MMPIRAIVGLVACVALAMVTYGVVTHDSSPALDMAAMTWAHTHGNALAIEVMQWVSRSGGPSTTSAYAALLVILWLIRRELATAAGVATIVYGGVALNIAFKHLVRRGRPVLEGPLMQLPTYSFPSGHAVAATVFGGLMVMMMLRDRPREKPNAPAIGAIILWIACVCASRIYLRAHYPTDVLAGVLEGLAWLMFGSLALDRGRVSLNWPKAVKNFL